MRTYQHRVVVFAALALLPWLGGCVEEPKKLVPQEQLAKSDIPVPSGFEMDEASSEDRSAVGGGRYVRHVYLGKADNQLVRAFFREQMPVERWNLMSDEMRQGQYVMQFEKGSEVCEVTISVVGKGWLSKTKLRIEVSPRGRIKSSKSAEEKPVP
jgi:hypothetical protein